VFARNPAAAEPEVHILVGGKTFKNVTEIICRQRRAKKNNTNLEKRLCSGFWRENLHRCEVDTDRENRTKDQRKHLFVCLE
jgi:hypothetical protein